MASETELLRLAVVAYEAAAEPSLWPRFLELYSDAVSGDTILLQIHDLDRNRSNILFGFNIASPFKQSYNEHYSRLNIWRERGRALYVAGGVSLDQEHCPRFVFESSEFYNDYLRRMNAAHSMGAVIARRQSMAPTLTALRGHGKGEFGETERQAARFLMPHLIRAWAVYEKLELLAAGESVLNKLQMGIVFVAPSGQAVYYNEAAEEIFRCEDGLTLKNGALCATDRLADAQLRKAIDDALMPKRPPGRAAVAVPRRSLRRSYQLVAAPLRGLFQQFAGMAAPLAVVFLTDPECHKAAGTDVLIQLYGLTPKEAALAAKLSAGESIEHAAEEMGMKYQTARSHLRHIFSKTGTSRQAELVLLIARLPGGQTDRTG